MGKLGVIFAFLLSVAAAGGSYYLYQGWVEERTVRGTIEAKYDQVKEKMISVQSEKEQIKAEKEQISAKSEEYRTKAEAMQSQLGRLQAEQRRIDSEKASLEKELKSHQQTIAELQSKMGELEKKAKDAQAACGVTPADMNTDPFAVPSRSYTNTPQSEPAAPAHDVVGGGSSQLVFKPVGSGRSAESSAAPLRPVGPSLSGSLTPATPSGEANQASQLSAVAAAATGPKVLTVNRKFNFVVINLGLQDGLKMGDKLKVIKQDKEIATVQVEKLYDKFSAATLVEEDPNQQVVEGDEIRKA